MSNPVLSKPFQGRPQFLGEFYGVELIIIDMVARGPDGADACVIHFVLYYGHDIQNDRENAEKVSLMGYGTDTRNGPVHTHWLDDQIRVLVAARAYIHTLYDNDWGDGTLYVKRPTPLRQQSMSP